MQTTIEANKISANSHADAIKVATSRVAPLWPLTHFVAVNPFVGLTQHPFTEACGMLQKATGAMPVQSAQEYRDALNQGRILMADLRAVADEQWPVERLIEKLEDVETEPVMTFADFLDHQRPHAHWEILVEDEISKWCGVAFDQNQTTWNSPWMAVGLFTGWRDAAEHDCNPEAYGLKGFRSFVKSLPHTAEEVIEYCMKMLQQPQVNAVDFLHRQLMTISGWAGYLQYRVREASMRGEQSAELRDLLAIRLAYDAALYNAFAQDGTQRSDWRRLKPQDANHEWVAALSRWQDAYELGYQRELAGMLTSQPQPCDSRVRPAVQAVFCIDVRSERIRRNLEAALPGAQTIGFAGFFGFPISHHGAGKDHAEARCPVLLLPPVECPDVDSESNPRKLQQKWSSKRTWKAFQNSAASCFSFVEAMGLGFVSNLLGNHNKSKPCCPSTPQPDLKAMPIETLTEMAEGALRNMSLTKHFARLVLICGHGSHSSNNPYASALDCGACGGHAGDLNARLAAMVLNQPHVRRELMARGIEIPEDTVFLAGLHDTLSDQVSLLDAEEIPKHHQQEVAILEAALVAAGQATRVERAESLGIKGLEGEALELEIKARGQDISQVRPEWGLANNAAIFVGSRSRTAGLNLDGRVFLHDYDASADKELKVLNLIMCAPVVVASWINLQYYGSRVNPEIYGSGDKALHNVSGGIGVMEGNGGDIRTGLPMQSIHDGEKFIHEPRRLTVFIESSRDSIMRVLTNLPEVCQLFDNGWIHLAAIEGDQVFRYSGGDWVNIHKHDSEAD